MQKDRPKLDRTVFFYAFCFAYSNSSAARAMWTADSICWGQTLRHWPQFTQAEARLPFRVR